MKEKRNTYDLNLKVNDISTNSKYNPKWKKESNDKNLEENDYKEDILNQLLITNLIIIKAKIMRKFKKRLEISLFHI